MTTEIATRARTTPARRRMAFHEKALLSLKEMSRHPGNGAAASSRALAKGSSAVEKPDEPEAGEHCNRDRNNSHVPRRISGTGKVHARMAPRAATRTIAICPRQRAAREHQGDARAASHDRQDERAGDRFIAADSGVQEACQDKHSQRETRDPKHSFEERPAILKFRTQKQSEKPGAVTDPNQRAQHARGSEERIQHSHKHRREGEVGKPLRSLPKRETPASRWSPHDHRRIPSRAQRRPPSCSPSRAARRRQPRPRAARRPAIPAGPVEVETFRAATALCPAGSR